MFCDCCNCKVPAKGWDSHVNGKKHKSKMKLQLQVKNAEFEKISDDLVTLAMKESIDTWQEEIQKAHKEKIFNSMWPDEMWPVEDMMFD